jgi:predicted PurR-regulated permease PerM
MKKQTPNQSKMVKDLLIYTLLIFGIGWVIYTYQVLFSPLIIACLIAYLLYPSVTWISDRTHIKRQRIVPIVYLVFLAIMILVVIFLAPIIFSQFFLLADQLVRLPDLFENAQTTLARDLGLTIPLDTLISDFGTDMGQFFKPDRLFRIIQGASTNFVLVLITIIASFYLLRDWDKLRDWLFGLSPKHLESDFRRLHLEIKSVWHIYLRGQLLIMTILGVLSGIGAAVIGIPGALILGFLAGTLALIPSLGPATATAIAAIVAWTQGSQYLEISNITATLLIVIIFLAIQFIEGFWLTPQIMSRRLKLHPGLVLIAVVGTLFTLGALMALIIIPLLGSLEIIFHYVRKKQSGLDPLPIEEIPLEMDASKPFIDAEIITVGKPECDQFI